MKMTGYVRAQFTRCRMDCALSEVSMKTLGSLGHETGYCTAFDTFQQAYYYASP
jgi:hypothetical protein